MTKILVADYDRQDGYLTKRQVERVLEKRQLSIDECSEVLSELENLGVTIDSETEKLPPTIQQTILEDRHKLPASKNSFTQTNMPFSGFDTSLLTAEDEIELGRRIALGNRAKNELECGIEKTDAHRDTINRAGHAKERMVVSNLRLVLYTAKPYAEMTTLSLDDLVQEGVIGLMRAAEKYDYTLGYKFSTYAIWWIRQSVTRAMADKGSTIRLPVHIYADVHKLGKATNLLSQVHPDRHPTISELADELTWTSDKVHFIQQLSMLIAVSLNDHIPGTDKELVDMLMSRYETPDESLDQYILSSDIQKSLECLKERERAIINLRFGLSNDGVSLTLEEIGKIYGLTRERIRQIEVKALQQLFKSARINPEHCLFPYMEDMGCLIEKQPNQ